MASYEVMIEAIQRVQLIANGFRDFELNCFHKV